MMKVALPGTAPHIYESLPTVFEDGHDVRETGILCLYYLMGEGVWYDTRMNSVVCLYYSEHVL
jgi:hypothetical protein